MEKLEKKDYPRLTSADLAMLEGFIEFDFSD